MWSADGKHIAFSYQHKTADASGKKVKVVAVHDLDINQTHDLYSSTYALRLLGWDDLDKGLYVAESEKQYVVLLPFANIRLINVQTRQASAPLTLKNVYFYNIFLSDNKKLIAYASRDQDRDDIWVVPSTGGAVRRITSNNDSGVYYSRLAWLHDGSAVIFGKQTRFSLLSMINFEVERRIN
jgi:Tol biopolymer transport system component